MRLDELLLQRGGEVKQNRAVRELFAWDGAELPLEVWGPASIAPCSWRGRLDDNEIQL